jgi:hypothetical protein
MARRQSAAAFAASGARLFNVAAAPSFLATASFASSMSTEMIFSCPKALSISIAISPRPPAPSNITHSSRGIGLSCDTAE